MIKGKQDLGLFLVVGIPIIAYLILSSRVVVKDSIIVQYHTEHF